MTDDLKHGEGLWHEFLLAMLDAEARKDESPIGQRRVADVAVDSERLAVDQAYRHGLLVIKYQMSVLRESKDDLRKAVEAYDRVGD